MLLETDRLVLRRFRVSDAEFVLELVNDPSFVRFIGDRGLRTPGDARSYIQDRFLAADRDRDIGPYLVELKAPATAIGLCSLLKREWLADIDLGFAFLPAYRSKGYAFESASALLHHAFRVFGLRRLVAITNPANAASIRLLEKLGFRFEHTVRTGDEGPELMLFGVASEQGESRADEDRREDREIRGDPDFRLRQGKDAEQQ